MPMAGVLREYGGQGYAGDGLYAFSVPHVHRTAGQRDADVGQGRGRKRGRVIVGVAGRASTNRGRTRPDESSVKLKTGGVR